LLFSFNSFDDQGRLIIPMTLERFDLLALACSTHLVAYLGLCSDGPKAMQRGLFMLFLQLFICVAITAVGLWALIRLRRFQIFLNNNFALLRAVKDGWQIAPIALRFIGALLILYGYMFASSYAAQLLWLARLFIGVAEAASAK
jgi:hypothetical protein